MTKSPVWANRFAGRRFLVTGASGGIGGAVVERLAAEGAQILAADVNEYVPATEALARSVTAVKLDVTDEEAWQRTVAEAVATGGLDGLVLSHGVTQPQVPTAELHQSDWRRVIDINLTGCFLGVKAVLPHLTGQGFGRIVVVASIAAKEANAGEHVYAASKAGVVGLVKSVGKEVATTGVTVNALAPGPVGTELFYAMGPQHNQDRLRRVPMGRPAAPAEAGSIIAWLLSEEAAYSTGQCFDLSGGRAVF